MPGRIRAATALAVWLAGIPVEAAADAQHRTVRARTQISAWFTPDEDAAARLLEAIAAAREEVLVQAFLFTNRRIAAALTRVRQRGVRVQVILDREQFQTGETVLAQELLDAGVTVFLDGQHAAAHNKIIIIDGSSAAPTVVTGSFNFTVAAQQRNAENLLIIHGNRPLAQRYRANWQTHLEHSDRLP